MVDHAGEELSTPVEDQNIQTPAAVATGTPNPAVPDDHAQQTPEFLTKLIVELNRLRQESSDLFAKMYPMSVDGPPAKPAYEELADYKRQDAELDRKIGALRSQIDDLVVLLARPKAPAPELTKAAAPSGPALAGVPEQPSSPAV